MADWVGKCSPLGKMWAVELKPGSDTDFQEVFPISSCKPSKREVGFVRELDVIFPLEEYFYISRTEFPSENGLVEAQASMQSFLPFLSGVESLADFESVLARLQEDDVIALSSGIDLAAVRELSRQDFIKAIDSTMVSLYTENKDGVEALTNFWVLGTKDIDVAVQIASKIEMEGRHEILLKDSFAGEDLIILRVQIPLSDAFLASEGIKFTAKKNVVTTCTLGDSVICGIGWALQGYGLGGYGL